MTPFQNLSDLWYRQFFWYQKISGWWYTYPSEKCESQLGVLFQDNITFPNILYLVIFPIYVWWFSLYWVVSLVVSQYIPNVPNHQTDLVSSYASQNPIRCAKYLLTPLNDFHEDFPSQIEDFEISPEKHRIESRKL